MKANKMTTNQNIIVVFHGQYLKMDKVYSLWFKPLLNRYELTLATSENHGLDLIESWHNATFEQIQNDLKAKQFVKLKDYNQIKIKFD